MLLPLAAEKASYVSPGLGMVLWLVVGLAALLCLPIVVAKARWGWLLIGVFTAGVGWIIGATRPARPGSLLSRWRDKSSTV